MRCICVALAAVFILFSGAADRVHAAMGDQVVPAPFSAKPPEASLVYVAEKKEKKRVKKRENRKGEKRKASARQNPNFGHCNFNACLHDSTVNAQACEDQKKKCVQGATKQGGDMCEPGYLCAKKVADCYVNVAKTYQDCLDKLGDGEAVRAPAGKK